MMKHLEPSRKKDNAADHNARGIPPANTDKADLAIGSVDFRVLGGGASLKRNGVCCQTDRYIPPFREIGVDIVLPSSIERHEKLDREIIKCSAIVVSCEELAHTGKYDMAVYFVGLSERNKRRIERFVKRFFRTGAGSG